MLQPSVVELITLNHTESHSRSTVQRPEDLAQNGEEGGPINRSVGVETIRHRWRTGDDQAGEEEGREGGHKMEQ